MKPNVTANCGKQANWDTLPYVHLAFINAVQLSSYALQTLNLQPGSNPGSAEVTEAAGLSTWQICLDKLAQLPHCQLPDSAGMRTEAGKQSGQSNDRMPCICLLPPNWAKLEAPLAAALQPKRLKEQGLLPVALQDYSEAALLKAVQQGIEHFYPQAFRPDPTVKALEKYLDWLEKNGNAEAAISPTAAPSTESKTPENRAFTEDVGLPLAMRYSETQLNKKQLLLAENLSSRQIHCYWLEGDAPLLSLELSRALYDKHHRYAAELSYSDIYPQGLVPVLFQAAVLSRLWYLHRHQPTQSGQVSPVKSVENAEGSVGPSGQVKRRLPSILEIAERDLNLFAVEPLLTDKDYRLLRLDLRASNKRQFLTLQNLCHSLQDNLQEDLQDKSNGATSLATLDKILYWVEHSAESLRSLPRYFPIQISALCPQSCSYCPYPQIMGRESFAPLAEELLRSGSAAFMSRDLWRKLLAAIVDFVGDGVIDLSPLGEPLLHPDFVGLVQDLWQYPDLQLVIETSGAQWRREDVLILLAMNHREPRITWIVGLDALDPELYRQLRAPTESISPLTHMTASQRSAHDLVDLLLHSDDSLPQQVYVQAVRMKENEGDLEAFYRYWAEGKKPTSERAAAALNPAAMQQPDEVAPGNPAPVATQQTQTQTQAQAQVIVQKYNSYANFLSQRQPLRLDPVERFPCRRLAREMVFGLDGQVYLCVQDLQQELARQLKLDGSLGSFPQQSLEQLWQFGHKLYRRHIDQAYPALCQNCDEYYVYNF